MCSLSALGAEAYACYTSSNTTLTFYYDNYRSSRTGTTYDVNTDGSASGWYEPAWHTDSTCVSVTRVVFNSSFANARPHTTSCWFRDMRHLQSITGLYYLNTSQVITMHYMFGECAQLTSLDLSGFNTSQVDNMSRMFKGCSGLTSLNLSRFDTGNMWYCYSMFSGCSNLTTIYVADGWVLDNDALGGNMFDGCVKLRGGRGTTYDSSHVDKAYAHVDGGPSNPGYFTAGYLLGDVNRDVTMNIADVTAVIDYILTGDASEIYLGAGDVNFDNTVNIADVTTMIDFILTGVW